MLEKIRSLLQQGEGLKIEFKEAQGGMPKSVYETVCAFKVEKFFWGLKIMEML